MSSFQQPPALNEAHTYPFTREWLEMTEIAKRQLPRDNPDEIRLWQWITQYPGFAFVAHPLKAWSIAMQIVYRGDIGRVRRLFEEIRPPLSLTHHVWFFKGKNGQTLLDAATGENHREIFPQTFAYVQARTDEARTLLAPSQQQLRQWDQYVEIAKSRLGGGAHGGSTRRLMEYLRGHSQWCYLLPVSTQVYRKWTIAMQTVYHGDIHTLQSLLTACPMVDPCLWFACGNDGKSMVDVAASISSHNPAMWQFVVHRCFKPPTPTHNIVSPVPVPVPPVPQPNPVPTPAPAPAPAVTPTPTPTGEGPLSLETVQALWPSLPQVNISRGHGVCPIMGESAPLFACSLDCGHKCSRDGLLGYIQSRMHSGPFPIRCAQCSALSLSAGALGGERGFFTRSYIKALCTAGILTDTLGAQRLLLQQMRNLPNEDTLDLLYRSSKPCPGCHTPITKYKGHGCHHIKPGQGCPGCHNHFCYVCLGGLSPTWQGCGNGCPGFCNANCDCPICPDCTPGHPCDLCSGNCPACRN